MSKKMGKKYSILSLLLSSFFIICLKNAEAGPESNEPKITERIIKIEGTLEKPRVIFIVPRAELWKKNIFKKRFIDDIIKPVYPKYLAKKFSIEKQKK